ncbi:hypothetical protein [Tenacibaculum finnmarkense]|uniref:hypothetical protein n=1 Tax=Tenacibaculum finnmarkense TaxID=2781243 RepID=UPI001E491123|nr:hypothetical protein [Tenacibaculum finnmarkense]MCD8445558.1 hypothetical protein [Tenacibaculum finnmarkense genomovar ulcerans]MCG8804042.1 hypothetical protein [Tenacibaculum finnmarkense]MCG8826754.1 hypothetical protein [Tenacibaculum finnmarkense]MCG8860116.1 hypothetical protein [Tenacibaculum finnmarkense]
MKKILLTLILGIITTLNYAQEKKDIGTEKIWRVNFLNPAIELEIPTGQFSTFSSALGIGYGGGYPDLTSSGNGFIYIISPFADFQQKWFYNLNKRNLKDRNTENNSGNFVSLRFVTRGNSIAENVYRTSNFDFTVGPTWGIQRKYGKNFHLLFDIGPIYYLDTKGNGNFYPILLQLNLGFDLKKK